MQIYVEHWGGWFSKIDHFSILGGGVNLAKLIIFRYMGGCKLAIQLLALPIIGLVHSFCSVAHPESGKGEGGAITGGLGQWRKSVKVIGVDET